MQNEKPNIVDRALDAVLVFKRERDEALAVLREGERKDIVLWLMSQAELSDRSSPAMAAAFRIAAEAIRNGEHLEARIHGQ